MSDALRDTGPRELTLVWERPAGRVRPSATLRGFRDGLGVAVVVPVGDDRVLLAASGDDEEDDVVRLWDPVTGEQVGGPLRENSKQGGRVIAMVALPFAGGHTRLATAHYDEDDDGHVVYLWDTVTGEQVGGPLPGPESASSLVAVPTSDGRNLLAITPHDEEGVWLWDAATAERAVGPLSAPASVDDPSAMTAVTLADGRTLLATAHDQGDSAVVCLWDPVTGELVQTLLCPHEDEGWPSGLVAVPLPDGGRLLALSFNYDDHETVRLWDVATGAPVGGPITGLGMRPVPMADGTTLLSIGSGLWDPASGRRIGDLGTNRVPAVVAAVPLPDGPTLLAGEVPGGAVWLWDPTAVESLTEPEEVGWDGLVAPVTVPDGRTLLATRSDTTVWLWDLRTGEAAGQLHTGDVDVLTAMAAAPLPDGRTVVVTAHRSGALRSWDPATGGLVGSVPPGRTSEIRTMVPIASSDGRILLATGSHSGIIRLRDPETCETASDVFNRPDRPPLALARVPMPDGRTLLASSEATPARGGTRAVRLWDPATGLPVGAPFENHKYVEHLAAMPLADGRTLLAVRDFDDSIRVWDADSRQLVGELTGGPMAAIVASGGHPLLAVARRGAIELWDPLTRRWVGSRPLERPIRVLAGVGSNLVVGCADGLGVLDLVG
ncbi:WD40 repeat domain-containing protein [Streptomyces sp. NY05-11A]|uniref:WD40 repeat domain-containing protein n=1 Tax=Streptomyces soliscabiei TaxID=588897 RepID=UPI0029AFB0E0|nr:WD40 repeat domain-containing protein [Streptomyces sp. NY05-11A]MDX2680393.1 WD40 repeat domain-containing protein [Streptomyces sp. NY05-11A]